MPDQLQQIEILIGDDADAFFQSDIGQYIIGRAQQDRDEALAGLKNIDPENAKEIRNLQNKIYIAESSLGWLQEMLIAGRQAMETLQESQ